VLLVAKKSIDDNVDVNTELIESQEWQNSIPIHSHHCIKIIDEMSLCRNGMLLVDFNRLFLMNSLAISKYSVETREYFSLKLLTLLACLVLYS
jgi:hypothetical protein